MSSIILPRLILQEGFREDDYRRYRLWQDTEEIGHPEAYYRERGYEYIIHNQSLFLTDRR